MQSYKKEFAKFLVRAEALIFGEFRLKSGRSSPYFFNSSKFNTGVLRQRDRRFISRVSRILWVMRICICFDQLSS